MIGLVARLVSLFLASIALMAFVGAAALLFVSYQGACPEELKHTGWGVWATMIVGFLAFGWGSMTFDGFLDWADYKDRQLSRWWAGE